MKTCNAARPWFFKAATLLIQPKGMHKLLQTMQEMKAGSSRRVQLSVQVPLGADSVPSHALLLAGVQRLQRAGVQHHNVRTLGLLVALKSNTSSGHLQEFNHPNYASL